MVYETRAPVSGVTRPSVQTRAQPQACAASADRLRRCHGPPEVDPRFEMILNDLSEKESQQLVLSWTVLEAHVRQG